MTSSPGGFARPVPASAAPRRVGTRLLEWAIDNPMAWRTEVDEGALPVAARRPVLGSPKKKKAAARGNMAWISASSTLSRDDEELVVLHERWVFTHRSQVQVLVLLPQRQVSQQQLV